ncbi:uncharacterized protein FOMMEDRAFT_26820 [Fomitiporia mediterranea MF3/22]|uniref:uncharacterized protein n=1 Tax=Fomitiporia mediterranea (strain MF3/22) TaxID=694068 RepID=UPI0004408FA4|nr:uncharacterized protein FOMMEDRAFT_26820 [Fomitiporia mediterranea MF3/22]EJD06052.1 hypothetical protein FOMMEDRAFT_26820 [Fomitiporia mediterranea MF3/22]
MSKKESSNNTRNSSTSHNPRHEYDKALSGAFKAIVNPYIEVILQYEVNSLYERCKKAREEKHKEEEAIRTVAEEFNSYQAADKSKSTELYRIYMRHALGTEIQKYEAKWALEDLIEYLNILSRTVGRCLDIDTRGQVYISQDLKEKNKDLQSFLVQMRDAVNAALINKAKMLGTLQAACKALKILASTGNSEQIGQVEEIYKGILESDGEMPSKDDSHGAIQKLESGKEKMKRYKRKAEAFQVKGSVHDKCKEAREEFKKATEGNN